MHLRVRCPAKINLFLSVGAKDFRNYHPIRTIFQAIDLSDYLVIREGTGRHIVECSNPSVPPENTVTKALRLLTEVLPLPPLHITIEKNIPSESGLGGGSSDAAGIIRAAQRIGGVSIPFGELKGIAEAVGMDVPFFLIGGRAKGEGYGEILTSLADPEPRWLVVARPNVGCGTAEAYHKLDAAPRPWLEFPDTDMLHNDFEIVAPPGSLDLIQKLRENGASQAALTGSGSAVFGLFDSRQLAEDAAQKIKADRTQEVWTARYLTRNESCEMDH